jgi:hypothetical protein
MWTDTWGDIGEGRTLDHRRRFSLSVGAKPAGDRQPPTPMGELGDASTVGGRRLCRAGWTGGIGGSGISRGVGP